VFDNSRLREISDKLAFETDEVGVREILAAATEAMVRISEGQKRKGQVVQELAELGAQREELKAKLLGPEVEDYYTVRKQLLANMEAVYRKTRDEVKTLEASVVALERQLAELAERARELEALRAAVAGKQRDAAEWRWLERATGADGIQALELDALGPSIADTANKLLSAAYGSRFQVSFRTTRIGGTGSHKKMIEDFEIWISDSEDGSEQLLETLSGGESVWIKNALYSAFAIIRDRSTGQRFLTVFLDEADGQLDPEAKLKYFQMIEAAHVESGRRHTIIVTHSEAAQEMVSQRINMEGLHAAEKVLQG
jgi:exonuclease SbcC